MDLEINSIEEFTKLCRLCMNFRNEMSSIYDHLSPYSNIFPETQFAEMIEACIPVNIHANDLPQMVCSDCLNIVGNFYFFQKQCQQTELKLYKILENLNAENKNDDLLLKVEENSSETFVDKISENSNFISSNVDVKNEGNIVDSDSIIESTKETDVKVEDSVDNSESILFSNHLWQCPFCLKLFTSKSKLNHHEDYDCKQKFCCDFCSETFNNFNVFQEHVANENQHLFLCDLCNSRFTSQIKLLSHFQVHLATDAYFDCYSKSGLQCYICTEEFNSFEHLDNHLEAHQFNGSTEYICRKCEVLFDTNVLFRDHLKSVHGIRHFTCNDCVIGFHYQPELVKHVRSHEYYINKQKFSCSMCENTYENKLDLKFHLRDHMDSFCKCSICSKTCSTLTDICAHYGRHERPSKRVCPICGIIKPRDQVHVHENDTVTDIKFECAICGKYFVSKASLKKHTKIHTDDKPFICSECGGRFIEASDLNIHMRTHTGEKPYPCKWPDCGKSFRTSSACAGHWRTHTGERNHCCKYCKRKFTTSFSLKIHCEVVHLQIKRFACDICGKKFVRRYRLLDHKNKVHGIPK